MESIKKLLEEIDLIEEYITNVKKGIQPKEIIHKNEINLKYMTEEEGEQRIFGSSFVENNKDNINLIINGKESELVDEYFLKEGENNITIRLKNTLTNLSNMFYFCESLYNIEELKYLNTENVTDFSYMFGYCKISNINALENWDTSKSETFNSMFYVCETITNLKALKNWNISNCKDLSHMFHRCNISDIKVLANWNVANVTNFHEMFSYNLISSIKPLENWDVSNATNLGGIS